MFETRRWVCIPVEKASAASPSTGAPLLRDQAEQEALAGLRHLLGVLQKGRAPGVTLQARAWLATIIPLWKVAVLGAL
jgi:hypothetical protein